MFTNLQISLFNNFFIKSRSQDTIYTFKNYFVTTFFSFQFSIFNNIQTDVVNAVPPCNSKFKVDLKLLISTL